MQHFAKRKFPARNANPNKKVKNKKWLTKIKESDFRLFSGKIRSYEFISTNSVDGYLLTAIITHDPIKKILLG